MLSKLRASKPRGEIFDEPDCVLFERDSGASRCYAHHLPRRVLCAPHELGDTLFADFQLLKLFLSQLG